MCHATVAAVATDSNGDGDVEFNYWHRNDVNQTTVMDAATATDHAVTVSDQALRE